MGNAIYRAVTVPPTEYQKWEEWADSPQLTSDFPYQCIVWRGGLAFLCIAKDKIYQDEDGALYLSGGYYVYYDWRSIGNPTWLQTGYGGTNVFPAPYEFQQANTDIYADSSLTSIAFAQTTPSASVAVWNRARNARNKSTAFKRTKSAKHKNAETWKRVNL